MGIDKDMADRIWMILKKTRSSSIESQPKKDVLVVVVIIVGHKT